MFWRPARRDASKRRMESDYFQPGGLRRRIHRPERSFRSCRGARASPEPAWAHHRRARCGTKSRSEEHTSELQSHLNLVCRLLLEKKKKKHLKRPFAKKKTSEKR